MKARVRSDSRITIVTAFTGREYIQYEYRPIPDGCEVEALDNPFLEVIEDVNLVGSSADPDHHEDLAPVSVEVQDEAVSVPRTASPVISEYCQGMTKSGKPCKRKALANGYCSLHGGEE